ncbi:MAG: hypothetical protein NC133_01265 [Prevotella sp.]|nr:hypothetical protein [Prevotella sp.]
MEPNQQEQTEKFDLMSFDLGEAGGGKQVIFAHKAISATEHYVFTLGNPPKNAQNAADQPAAPTNENATKGALGKQLFSNFRDRLANLKNTNKPTTVEENPLNPKLRCFKLSLQEGKKYLVEEYTTPQSVANIARLFGAGQTDPEITR